MNDWHPAHRPGSAPVYGSDMAIRRATLTRQEFTDVASGRYRYGQQPQSTGYDRGVYRVGPDGQDLPMVIDPRAQHRARLDMKAMNQRAIDTAYARAGRYHETPNLPVRTHVMTNEVSTQVLRWWMRYWRMRLDSAQNKGQRSAALGAVSTLVDQLTMRVRH